LRRKWAQAGSGGAGKGPNTPPTDKKRGKNEKSLVFQMLPVDGQELPMTFYSQPWG
jgi:hypothetical protein